jgi:hypothetical protein
MIGASISRWTMSYFAVALSCLLISGSLMAAGFGYPSAATGAPDTLVVVHILVIGWLGLLFCGALLQFIPVLVAKPLIAGWLAAPSLVAIVAGLACLVTGFLAMGGHVDAGMEWLTLGAASVACGFGALTVSFVVTLPSARPLGIPARMVAVALASLVMTVLLGVGFSVILSGADVPLHLYDLLPGAIPFHAAFGLVGWMTLTALGVSYRLFTMFMLAPEGDGTTGRWTFYAAAAALVTLVIALCATVGDLSPQAYLPGVAVCLGAVAVGLYARDVLRIYQTRRRKVLELNTSASLIALGFLPVSLILLVAANFVDDPSRLAAPAVYLFAMGWLSGLGLGQLYKIIPFLTWLECYGPVMGKTAVPRVQDLVKEGRAARWFWMHFVSVGLGGLFLILDALPLFRAAAACQMLAAAGLAFEYLQARRLSCASADMRLPKGAVQPHLILPRT